MRVLSALGNVVCEFDNLESVQFFNLKNFKPFQNHITTETLELRFSCAVKNFA